MKTAYNMQHIFFEKYTDNFSSISELTVSFISLYFILSKSEYSKYGAYSMGK